MEVFFFVFVLVAVLLSRVGLPNFQSAGVSVEQSWSWTRIGSKTRDSNREFQLWDGTLHVAFFAKLLQKSLYEIGIHY